MANMIDFEGSNCHAGPPAGKEDSIGYLHCFRNGSCVVSAWQLTEKEIEEVIKTGIVYLSVMSGPVVLPVYVGSEREVAAVVADTGALWR